jgi:hypothetical protein
MMKTITLCSLLTMAFISIASAKTSAKDADQDGCVKGVIKKDPRNGRILLISDGPYPVIGQLWVSDADEQKDAEALLDMPGYYSYQYLVNEGGSIEEHHKFVSVKKVKSCPSVD